MASSMTMTNCKWMKNTITFCKISSDHLINTLIHLYMRELERRKNKNLTLKKHTDLSCREDQLVKRNCLLSRNLKKGKATWLSVVHTSKKTSQVLCWESSSLDRDTQWTINLREKLVKQSNLTFMKIWSGSSQLAFKLVSMLRNMKTSNWRKLMMKRKAI